MKKVLMDNLGLKLIALAISIFLWMVVINEEDPVKTTTFPNIPVTVVNAEVITHKGNTYIVDEASKTVSVTVTAKMSVMRNIDAGDIRAIADMKNLQFGTLIPIEVTIPEHSGATAEAKTANLLVSIEMETVKSFPITPVADGSVRDGYQVGELLANPKQIEITGPKSVVDSIAKVVAKVDVNGLSKNTEKAAELYLYDESGISLDQTFIEHNLGEEGVSVDIKIYQTKLVPVEFNTLNVSAAEGYVVESVSFEPGQIEVVGPKEKLETLEKVSIPAAALQMRDLSKTTEQAIDISAYLPEWSKQNAENAEVIILVKAFVTKEGTKTIEYPTGGIVLENVPDGYKVEFADLSSVEIVVSGSADALKNFEFVQGSISLNLAGIKTAGTYELPLVIILDSGLELDHDVNVKINVMKTAEKP